MPRSQGLEGGGHTYQANHEHLHYKYNVSLQALEKSAQTYDLLLCLFTYVTIGSYCDYGTLFCHCHEICIGNRMDLRAIKE